MPFQPPRGGAAPSPQKLAVGPFAFAFAFAFGCGCGFGGRFGGAFGWAQGFTAWGGYHVGHLPLIYRKPLGKKIDDYL